MPIQFHECMKSRLGPDHPLAGKVVYIPAMAEGSVEALASVFRWLGIEAYPTPPSDQRTLELGAKYTNGDECYPAKVTVGDFLKIIEQPGFDPRRTAFMMATAEGPCRFGQYAPCLRKLLRELGYADVQIFSPSGGRGYSDIGEFAPFLRASWRALVATDILRKRLLQTRPYETVAGAADRVFGECVRDFCRTIEDSCSNSTCQLQSLVASLSRARQRFHRVPASYDCNLPLIGVVGEIFCRLNNFSNQDLVRRLEKQGAECWMTDIAEWIAYTNLEETRDLRLNGSRFSKAMLRSKVRGYIQRCDHLALLEPFREDFRGYEEPEIGEVIELARPYLPFPGAEGEMVVSTGRSAYLAKHGVDGVVDISPFTCMNGIVSEAIYPKLSQDYGGVPIRSFYFDGTHSELDRDLGMYLELVRSYGEKKRSERLPRHAPRTIDTDDWSQWHSNLEQPTGVSGAGA